MSFVKLLTILLVSATCFNIYFSNLVALSQSMLPSGSFFVSEINWDGSWLKDPSTNTIKSNSDDEWIELYNPTNTKISLSDYSVKGFSGSNKDLGYKDPLKCTIAPMSYLVVTRLTASLTTQNELGCIATNMSISNTIINFNITNKDNQIIDTYNIGDPSKITSNKNTVQKFSIYREDSQWLESSKTINISQEIDLNLGFLHFASPNGANLIVETDILPVIITQNLPFELKFTTNLQQIRNSWILTQKESVFYELECKSQNKTLAVPILPNFQRYCLRLKYTLESQGKIFSGYTDYNFELKAETIDTPKAIISIQITELDLNQDQIEIYNPDTADADLSDLFLQDTVGVVKKSKMTGWFVKPQSYAVFNTKSIGISLNNNGDNLVIYNLLNTQISSSSISSQGKTQSKNQSWQYFKDSNTWEESMSTLGRENQRAVTTAEPKDPPEKKPEIVPTTSQNLAYYQDKIRVNEIYPEGLEFVELYNISDEIIDLGGLKIKDLQGKIGTLTIASNTKIAAKAYLKIELKGKISLNNNGDGIALLTSQNDEIDNVVYQKSQGIDKSFQLIDDDWFWSKITPGEANSNTNLDQKTNTEIVATPKSTKTNQAPTELKPVETSEDCDEISIYIQTSKNIFYSNLGKIYIPKTTLHGLPSKMLVCDIKTKTGKVSAKFEDWAEELKYDKFESFNDKNKPKNLEFVQFRLSCKGKKNADIIRQDVTFKAVLRSTKPSCINNLVTGLGFVEKTAKNYILYYIGNSNISSKAGNTLIRTGGYDQFSEIFKLIANLKVWWHVLTH